MANYRTFILSYDVIDQKEWIDGITTTYNNQTYSDPRKYILTLIKHLKGFDIESPCESTVIFKYKDASFNISILEQHITEYFYFYISLIALDFEHNKIKAFNFNKELNSNIKDIFMNIN